MGGWLEQWKGWVAGEQAGGWRQVAGRSKQRREAGGWRQVAGGWEGEVAGGWLRWVGGWLEVAGMVLGGGVAGLVGFGIAYRYRTEPKLRNTGNTYTAKYRIRVGIDRTARLQPWNMAFPLLIVLLAGYRT